METKMIHTDKAAPKVGRPEVEESERKKGRNISLTNDEHSRLIELARAAKMDKSKYIIFKLGL